ncbi:MAG: hypothetical protein D6719_03260 [Candidatus Dadabacteria bacterium]|nr:MAG: hypothetical protein D6719_03260 [Candidatus Dadabacteria bacterium]
MSLGLIIAISLAFFGVLAALAILLDIPVIGTKRASRSNIRTNMRNIVNAQRDMQRQFAAGSDGTFVGQNRLYDAAEEAKVQRLTDSRLTLAKKLKYAQWKIPPSVFYAASAATSLVVFGVVSMYFNIVMRILALLSGPLFWNWLLTLKVDKRFKAFDADYPAFLMSVVGLLKTGMNTMAALKSAAEGLEPGSMVRTEVELMNERLRFGVSEDAAIGAFGEDIFHPEIELFVQALLLSRQVGGNLSDTLERLAKQVRKRQYFRNSASAAVGMQRGSIWFIIVILVLLEIYLFFIYPEAIKGAWADDFGWQVWQFGMLAILLGIFWVRQVTKIKI